MTKEQEIYKNMKASHGIVKSHGKWVIRYPALYMAIKKAGYSDEQIRKIIDRMCDKGYIHRIKWADGKERGAGAGLVIDKWVN